jgi:hypothetical protein
VGSLHLDKTFDLVSMPLPFSIHSFPILSVQLTFNIPPKILGCFFFPSCNVTPNNNLICVRAAQF